MTGTPLRGARFRRTVAGELLAEFLGTLVLIAFGDGVVAVAAIGMSFGANAGYAINPARDLGPRFFAWLAGWGEVALPGVHGSMWVPIVGPLVGGVVGAVVYDLFIRDVLRARGAPPAADVEARGETVEEQPAG